MCVMEGNEFSPCDFSLMRNSAEQEDVCVCLVCKLMEQLLLVLALLARQLTKASDGQNDRFLLASIMVDWPGGLYRLAFFLVLLQASLSAGSPQLCPSSGRLWFHRGGARGRAPAASSTNPMTHPDETAWWGGAQP